MCSEILQQICLSLELYSMTHGYATQERCFHVKYTHRYILYTHTTMRYRCEILNHGIHGYEVWLHRRNKGRSGVESFLMCSIEFLVLFYYKNTILYSFLDVTNHVLQLNPHCLIRFLSHFDKILSDFSI